MNGPTYFMHEYPKYLYHSTFKPIVVHDPKEENRLAKAGWVTHPDKLTADAPVPHKPIK